MAHFMNSEICTPLNNDMYTEYADVFSFLFGLSTLKLFRFSLLEMYVYNGKVSTTFAPAENSTFALNGWFMHTQSHIIHPKLSLVCLFLLVLTG